MGALHGVMKKTEELFAQQKMTPEQNSDLAMSKAGCLEVLNDLDDLLSKYESLGTKSQGKLDRMAFGMQGIGSIRLRLLTNVSMLDAFNNAYAHTSNQFHERDDNTDLVQLFSRPT